MEVALLILTKFHLNDGYICLWTFQLWSTSVIRHCWKLLHTNTGLWMRERAQAPNLKTIGCLDGWINIQPVLKVSHIPKANPRRIQNYNWPDKVLEVKSEWNIWPTHSYRPLASNYTRMPPYGYLCKTSYLSFHSAPSLGTTHIVAHCAEGLGTVLTKFFFLEKVFKSSI